MPTLDEVRQTGRSRGWDAANYSNAYSSGLSHGDEPEEGAAEKAADEYSGQLSEQERWQFVDGYGEGWEQYIREELED